VHVTDAERPPPGPRPSGRAIATLSGARHPIVAILLLIAFFTAISGKPIDGVLMMLVAAGLARDEGLGPAADEQPAASITKARLAQASAPAPTLAQDIAAPPAPAQVTATARGLARAVTAPPAPEQGSAPGTGRADEMRRRRALVVTGMACGALYAAVVGSFIRYSWPATVAVIGLGAAVVLLSWPEPVRRRPIPGPLPRRGTALWGGLLVAGGSWELSALLQQPNLAVDSYAHPTLSSLADPLLGSHLGRSLALAVWLAVGWLVVRR
jgi:hypothetical protein